MGSDSTFSQRHFAQRASQLDSARHCLRNTLIATALGCFGFAASAAQFAITYTGQAVQESGAGSNLPGTWGGAYNITLVLDNGGTSTTTQTWNASHVQCVIWNMRRQGATVFEQNTRLHPIRVSSGAVTTHASGALSTVFTTLAQSDNSLPSNAYTFDLDRIGHTPPLATITPGQPYWFIPNVAGAGGAPGYSGVFYVDAAGFDDAAGGVSVGNNLTGWSAPTPVSRPQCANQPVAVPGIAPTGTAAVPIFGLPGLALVGAAVAGMGMLGLRRRRPGARS